MRILIIEDDADLAKQLSCHLEQSGFITHVEHSGEEGHYQGDTGAYDLVLLDIGLPDLDGFQILERWRRDGRDMPVVIVTARTHKMETIRGLNAGADDYVNKPYDMEEVTARIHANIRRHKGRLTNVMKCRGVVFDNLTGKVFVDRSHVSLTRIEFRILQYLFMNQGKTVSMTELSEHAYEDFDRDSGVIARHISNIRKKIGDGVVVTDSNRGYSVPKD
jgi:two-component system OmpR family response regulator